MSTPNPACCDNLSNKRSIGPAWSMQFVRWASGFGRMDDFCGRFEMAGPTELFDEVLDIGSKNSTCD